MPDYNAGDAKLRLIPDASQFRERVEAELKKIKAELSVRMNIELAQAKADVERFRTEQQRNDVNVNIDPNLKEASAQMAAWRTAQRANSVTVPVNIDHRGTAGAAAAHGKKYGEEFMSAFSSAFKVNFASAGFGLIPGAVTAVASLTQALEQLSMAALVVPGALAGVGASLGTLILGVSGIGEAWKAVEKANEDATTNVAQNARTAAAAATQYRNAVVDEANAQRDVAQARRDATNTLKDLNLEMRGGALSEKEAVLAAAAARRDLANFRGRDAIEYQQAQLRVEEADQRVLEVRQRNAELQQKVNDANAKGVENSDAVVAAREREVRTNQQVTSSQQALNEATGAGNKNAEAAAAALAKLSPQAAQFVQTLIGLKPAFMDLRNTVSGNLFEGLSDPLRNLVSSIMPNLKTGLGGIATAWNETLRTLMGSIGSADNKSIMDRIFGNTAEAQHRANAAIDPLVRAFGTLTAAGSDTLPRLADALGKVSDRFAKFIENADKTGKLQQWIDAGLTGMTNLGNAIINLGKTFHNIHEALGGKGMLASLEDLTRRWVDWTGSIKGQTALKDFFDEGRRELEQWKPILHELPGMLKGLFDAATSATYVFLPVLREVSKLLGDNPALVSGVVTAFLAWKTISPIISGIQGTMGLLNTGIFNASTGFSNLRNNAVNNMAATATAIANAGGTPYSALGRFQVGLSGVISVLGAGLGVAGGLAAAVVFAISYLNNLGDAHKTAADRAKEQKAAEEDLLSTLDKFTGRPTAETREKVKAELQDWQGKPGQGWARGDVLAAASSIGMTPEQVTTAALPGGEAQLAQIQGKARAAIKQTIEKPGSAGGGSDRSIWQQLSVTGIDEDTVINAFLGNEDARKRLGDAVAAYNAKGGAEKIGLSNLEKMFIETANQQGASVAGAVLVGQAVTYEATAASSAAGKFRERRAAEPKARLNAAGKTEFGADAEVYYNGRTAQILTKTPPSDAQKNALSGGSRVEQTNLVGAPPEWTWDLSLDDTRKWLESYQRGGPTRAGLALLHDDEFVEQASAVDKYGLPFMRAVNEGRFPAFQGGGQFGPADEAGQQQGPSWLQTLIGGAGSAIGQGVNTASSLIQTGIGAADNLLQQAKAGTLSATLGPIWQGMGGQYDPTAGDYYSGPHPTGGQRLLPPPTPLANPVNMPDVASSNYGPGPDEIAWRAAHGFAGGGQPITFTIPGLNIPISIPTGNTSNPTDTSTNYQWDPNQAPPLGQSGGQQQGLFSGFNPALVPGLIGLAGSLAGPNPEQATIDWGVKTAQWLGNFAVNTATSFLTTIWSGALGMVGLENSILSPNNPYTSAAMKTAGFFGNMSATGTQDQPDTVIGTYDANGNIAYNPPAGGRPPGPGTSAQTPGGELVSANTASRASTLTDHGQGGTIWVTPDLLKSKGFTPLYNWSDTSAAGVAARRPDWLTNLVNQFGLQASTYSGGGTLHEGGYAWDISGPQDKMDAFAQFVSDNLAGQTLQLIHSNPTTGQKWGINAGTKVGPGTAFPDFYSKDWAGHGDHVHWAVDVAPNITDAQGNPVAGSPGGIGWRTYAPDASQVAPIPGLASVSTPGSTTGPTGGRGPGNQGQGLVMYSKTRGIYLLPTSFGDGTSQGNLVGPAANPPAVLTPNSSRSDLERAIVARGRALGLTDTEIRMVLAVGEHESNYQQPGFMGFGPEAKAAGFNFDTNPAGAIDQFYRQYTSRKPANFNPNDPAMVAAYIWHTVHNAADPNYGPALLASYGRYSTYQFDRGGILPKGVSIAVNNTGRNEHAVIIPALQGGGQPWFLPPLANVAPPPPGPTPNQADQRAAPAPLKAVGPSPSGVDQRVAPPSPPGPIISKADEMAAPPSPGPKAEGPPIARPAPAPGMPGAPISPIEAHPAPAAGAQPRPEERAQGPQPFAPGVESTQHNLPAVSTAITSGASAIGQAASTAIGVAAGLAGGAPGAAGAGAIGAIGPYVAGFIQQEGKVVESAANVLSSLLVGSVSMDSPYGAYGQTYRPRQNSPATAPNNSHVTNYNGGIVVADPNELRRELDLRDSQHFQSIMAGRI